MASLFKSGSSRSRKAEAPGKLRIVMKGFATKSKGSGNEDDSENSGIEEEKVGKSGIPEDLPEGTVVVEPQAVEDAPAKKKREAPVRIDTSVLDNVSCTACGRQLNPYKNNALQKHPELKVVICRRCDKFLSSGEIAKDKDGIDEQCRWCGEGGRLVVCDECSSAFCKSCVMRNFNRSEFNNINGQSKWRCYLCDKAPLQGLRETYRNIRDTLKALQARDKAKAAASGCSQSTSNGTKRSGKSNEAELSKSAVSTSSSSSSAKKTGQDSQPNNAAPSKGSGSGVMIGGSTSPENDNEVSLCASDLKVACDNVDVIMDKLSTATSTFREMLRALRSQFHSTSPRADDEDSTPSFHFSLSSSMSVVEKKRCCAKALNSSLQTYVKSLKTILTASDSIHSQDIASEKNEKQQKEGNKSVKELKSRQQVDGRDKTCTGMTTSKLSFSSSSSTKSNAENGTGKASPATSTRGESIRENSSAAKSSESFSFSHTRGGKAHKDVEAVTLIGDQEADYSTSSIPRQRESSKAVSKSKFSKQEESAKPDSSKNASKGQKKTSILPSKPSAKEQEGKVAKEKSVATDRVVVQKSKQKDGDETLHSESVAQLEYTPPGSSSGETNADTAQSSQDGELETTDPVACDNDDEENMAAKFDLIKELADEMLKSNEEGVEEGDSGESKMKSSEEEEAVSRVKHNGKEEDEPARSSSKRKVMDTLSSDDDSSNKKQLMKKSKTNDTSEKDLKEGERDKSDGENDGKSVQNDCRRKEEQNTVDEEEAAVAASDDASSSDVLMSSGDDDLGTSSARRKRKKNKKEVSSSKDKNQKQTKEAKPISKADRKLVANGRGKPTSSRTAPASRAPTRNNGKCSEDPKDDKEEEEDADEKEIEKLSKLPLMRKRKAKVSAEEGEEGSGEDALEEKTSKRAVKRNKPGPKSSKKNLDFEDLSSDGEDAKNEENEDEEEDDEDEPKVTFCVEPIDPGVEPEVDEENEMAKNGMLDELDSDRDEKEDVRSDKSSLDDDDDDSDVPKTRKKGGKKDSAQNEDEQGDREEKDDLIANGGDDDDDSDAAIGKKKQIRSKLLDTKLSDSDSDIDKRKKKKKEGDETFKAEASSGSSIESDLPSEEEEESDKDSEEEEEETEPKSKKKGKKKPRKRRGKKKKKGEDNDEDEDQEEDDEEEGGKKKKGKGKKRRRIKKMANSSDEDDDEKEEEEDEDDPNSSHTGKRKKIRKVMSNKKLEDSTRAAAKAEEKRRKRIAAKQREFNIETITDENNPMNCLITTKLVLEPGKEEGDDPVVQVNKKLVRKLKPHQVEAVQFMWDCMYESVKRSKKEQGAGCILAHCMGLGKTLSVISFVHTVLTHHKALGQRTCLVVSPLNTVLNWQNEWTMWLDEEDQLEVWELASCKQNGARADTLKAWHESGGIMIIGYEMYRNLTTGARIKNKKLKKAFQESLVDPGPDLVICDEGHILKNEASALSKAMNLMKTRRRVVLTGTPLQNNLNEYHCMVSFVKPNLLGTRKEFTNRFISPIQNGQCTDSTPRDVKLMKARAHVLHEMLAGCVQRRDYSALTKFLPPKQEYVMSVRLTEVQVELYNKYLELSGQGVDGVFNNKGARLFKDYQNLMKIWTHPWVLKLAEIRDELKMKYDDEDSFIDDDSLDERSFSSSNSSSEEDKKMSDSGGEGTSTGAGQRRGTRRTRAKARRQAGEDSDPEEVIAEWKSKTRGVDGEDGLPEETDNQVSKEWWAQFVTEDDKSKLELSNKLFLLFEILRMCEEIGDKVLIFSQSILSLNIIENFLENIDSKFQQECDTEDVEEKPEEEVFGRQWTKNLDYYRMDGSTSAQNRQAWAKSFNDLENYRARLFLISTKAGGLGINLVAANRVIIFDASWNPSHDVQSIFRVYRFGQTKPCYIYRFLAQGTMEEKIYERQVTKLSLSQRVVDEHQIERHFSAADLKELYTFTPDHWNDGKDKPTLALPKDPLLAEILTNNKHCVVSFHEHDSLLENQIEQTLTEEEKKAAWEEYENEKKGIIVRGPGMERTASWPMMAAAQILSREQITATVQTLRQQLPDVPEELFQLHVQQALRRMVQLKQEEMRRMEMMRLQEMNYLNMMKQEAQHQGLSHHMQSMASPWLQMQQLRALQSQMMQQSSMGAGASGMMNPAMMGAMMGAMGGQRLSNKPEDAIDLDASPSK